jgi:cyclic pyranopterin phosphate synthase
MSDFSHLDEAGRARMVDVSAKTPSQRLAVASGSIRMAATTLDAIRSSSLGKGDVLPVARVAAIMAAKKTAELIPLCHPVALTDIGIDFSFDDSLPGVRADAWARTLDRTGVEMEALSAVAVALLTIYDMAKALDRGMTITSIALVEKSGGRSGEWKRADVSG